MYGAILGDIVGSPYEFDENNIKTKEFALFSERSEPTDDSIMTIAVAEALMDCGIDADDKTMQKAIIDSMQKYGRRYPFAGYGMNFSLWLEEKDPKPYGSYGNGSAMRVSSVAWLCQEDYQKMLRIATNTAVVTHNHPEGIKGARATATAIFLALHGCGKREIRETVTREFGYDLSRTCDEIRPDYHHVESCQETVPQAITAFLESTDFEDAIRTAVSLGGDSDTLAAITGSIAEAFYGIPADLQKEAKDRLAADLRAVTDRFDEELAADRAKREADPSRMALWKKAADPNTYKQAAQKKDRGGKAVKGPDFSSGDDIKAKMAKMAQDRSRENMVQCLEAVRRAMEAGENFLVPVFPVQHGGNRSGTRREFRIQVARTKDNKQWQIVFTDGKAFAESKAPKGPAMAPTIAQVLEQFLPDAPGRNKAPENLSGILLNPDQNPLFLSRQTISEIFKVEERVQRSRKSSILVTRGDITKLKIRCIVNAANHSLLGGGGVDGAIHAAAGPELLAECSTLGGCKTGEARITKGYRLPAEYIIHTVGPVYSGSGKDAELLASCYTRSLDLAKDNDIHNIAFPNISTGVFGYPKEEAAGVAMHAVARWLSGHREYVMHVVLCCYDEENYALYKKMVEDREKKAAQRKE